MAAMAFDKDHKLTMNLRITTTLTISSRSDACTLQLLHHTQIACCTLTGVCGSLCAADGKQIQNSTLSVALHEILLMRFSSDRHKHPWTFLMVSDFTFVLPAKRKISFCAQPSPNPFIRQPIWLQFTATSTHTSNKATLKTLCTVTWSLISTPIDLHALLCTVNKIALGE